MAACSLLPLPSASDASRQQQGQPQDMREAPTMAFWRRGVDFIGPIHVYTGCQSMAVVGLA